MNDPLDEPVAAYYQRKYRLHHHATPKQRSTRAMFETELRTFSKAFHFHLAEASLATEAPLAIREPVLRDLAPLAESEACPTLRADDLLKYAMAWQVGRGRTKETANKLYRVLCAIWRAAFDDGTLPCPPRTKKFREATREPRCWSLAEMYAIIRAAEQEPGWVGGIEARIFFPAYCWCTYAVGSRQSVTLSTPVENFDERTGAILLSAELQKQDADQWLDLIPAAAAAMARLRSRERGLALLFGDWTYSITYFNKRLRRIIVRAGLRESPSEVTRWDLSHKFRRTFATFVTANSDEETARKLLGHSDISVTRRYLDKRFIGGVSARSVVPPLGPRPTDPDGDKPPLRIHRPEAG